MWVYKLIAKKDRPFWQFSAIGGGPFWQFFKYTHHVF